MSNKMKIISWCSIILFVLTNFLSAQNCKITVKFNNLLGLGGHLAIGLFNNPETFPKKDVGKKGISIAIEDSVIEYTFEKLQTGTYALAIYHDENSNGEFDRSFFGWPIENYVFSNYAEGSFGPPSFEDASFFLKDSLLIELEFK
jgi:uncharacterized protein (DUF2141 family)